MRTSMSCCRVEGDVDIAIVIFRATIVVYSIVRAVIAERRVVLDKIVFVVLIICVAILS